MMFVPKVKKATTPDNNDSFFILTFYCPLGPNCLLVVELPFYKSTQTCHNSLTFWRGGVFYGKLHQQLQHQQTSKHWQCGITALMAVIKGQAATLKEALCIDEKLTWKQIGLLFASISPLSKASWLLDWFLLLHIKMIQRTEQKKL